MNANQAQQQRLLEIAEIDQKLEQIEQVLKNPPGAQRVKELVATRSELNQTLLQLMAVSDDKESALAKLTNDVELVTNRLKRDNEQLQKQSDPKAALGFEREIESLNSRLALLEEQQLGLLEEQEAAAEAVKAKQAQIDELNAEGARVSAQAKAIISESTQEAEHLKRDRQALVNNTDAQLFEKYSSLRNRGSAGAALLHRRTCQGCHMVLSGSDIEEVAKASADTIVFCPSCSSILVRTAESGV